MGAHHSAFDTTQHNTHIVNQAPEPVGFVLTVNGSAVTSQVLPSAQWICIPTPHGRQTLSAYKLGPNETLANARANTKAGAEYTDQTDRSFIIRVHGQHMQIVRSKYGYIHQEETLN